MFGYKHMQKLDNVLTFSISVAQKLLSPNNHLNAKRKDADVQFTL